VANRSTTACAFNFDYKSKPVRPQISKIITTDLHRWLNGQASVTFLPLVELKVRRLPATSQD
jgi:hypothetical protein